MGRVSKKLVPNLQSIEGAILLVNAIDPQLATVAIFQEAIIDLPHFIILNKVDSVSVTRAQEIIDKLEDIVILASMTERRGLGGIRKELSKLPKGDVAILGIFNSGKTSLINELTGEYYPVADLPGTTLEFTSRSYEAWTLIDTVGQVIDVNQPLMVSIDFTDCTTLQEKITKVMAEDAYAIRISMESAIPSIMEAIELIKTQVWMRKKIIVSGAGASALVAMEMAGQGQETGLPILVFTNNFATNQPISFAKGFAEDELAMAQYAATVVDEGDVVIGISASGGTACIHELLRIAQVKKAHTIAITENSDTPLGKAADIIIKSEAKPEGPSSSKIQTAHLAIGHALILALADERGIDAQTSINFMLPNKVANKRMGIK